MRRVGLSCIHRLGKHGGYLVTIPSNKYTALTALLCSGLNGNARDYAKFLETIAPMLRRMVGRKLAAHAVEDVTQEILIDRKSVV